MFKLAENIDMAEQNPTNTINTIDAKKGTHPVIKFFRKVLYLFVFLIILGGIGSYLYVTHTVKDDASIEGTLLQFTVGDGFLFKTNEGTINKGTSLSISNWSFSVQDDSLAFVLKELVGKKVNLHYKENVSNFFWQGKTNRFVFEATEVK